MPKTRYDVTSEEPSPFVHRVSIKFDNLPSETHLDWVTRWVEFWCQLNCVGSWHVTEYDGEIVLEFSDDRDIVVFRLSEEFSLGRDSLNI